MFALFLIRVSAEEMNMPSIYPVHHRSEWEPNDQGRLIDTSIEPEMGPGNITAESLLLSTDLSSQPEFGL
jgi:hypothetical protein